MNTSATSINTLEYYANNAQAFAQSTLHVDMGELYKEFLPLLPLPHNSEHEKIHILDAGCGAGRDALAFKQLGYKVTAFDACSELADIASFHLQQSVYVKTFRQVKEQAQYHGIWCCASLLHVAHNELPDRFTKLASALKPNGILYASFKYGKGERSDGNRTFSDLTETCLEDVLAQIPSLNVVKVWQSKDQRPDRSEQVWLNVVVKKSPCEESSYE
ncbi:class I SAM-dependent methyltransferase [Pseudoalteromonas sp. MMG005]|uniref:class I SAM-dependent methyltransferase n=1 Tax=Pseudoalteromonas sp. MMG005 TaxID=2822682 RepID=UPI001B3A0CAB|nr:class I SAM-dependent methyltransferase [Pseudoalteromonas sp. MMG005]MBQ4844711.1 class I SAM-dependent methyltransferase [Pseudoalteromonas sp. MMG005]